MVVKKKKKIRSQKLLTTADSISYVLFFLDFTTALQDKNKTKRTKCFGKWAKDVPYRRIFTKLGESVQWRSIQALRMHTSKKILSGAKFCLFYYRLLLKKQSTKIKKHFEFLSVNASRTTANDQTERDTRQWGGGYTSTDVFQHSAQF